MARRTVLTGRQRSALFSLPQREADLLRHYTLSDEDLLHIGVPSPATSSASRCKLCVLRYPGRLLAPGAVRDPARASGGAYAACTDSGPSRGAARELVEQLREEAPQAQSNEDLVRRFIEACRRTRTHPAGHDDDRSGSAPMRSSTRNAGSRPASPSGGRPAFGATSPGGSTGESGTRAQNASRILLPLRTAGRKKASNRPKFLRAVDGEVAGLDLVAYDVAYDGRAPQCIASSRDEARDATGRWRIAPYRRFGVRSRRNAATFRRCRDGSNLAEAGPAHPHVRKNSAKGNPSSFLAELDFPKMARDPFTDGAGATSRGPPGVCREWRCRRAEGLAPLPPPRRSSSPPGRSGHWRTSQRGPSH